MQNKQEVVSGYKLITGTDPASTLQRAVARYVEANHGKVIVIGEVLIQRIYGDLSGNFTIGIRCTGTPPVPPVKKERPCKK